MTEQRPTPFALIILDGLALNPNPLANAVSLAATPCLDRLLATCPSTTLCAFGPRVGLPEGQMGNSEVGHLNIGGGRVVEQLLTKIDRTVRDGSIGQNPVLTKLCDSVSRHVGSALHLIGLLSTGGVHSQGSHFRALLKASLAQGVTRVCIHAITDGRDCPPNAAAAEFVELETFLSELRSEYPRAQIVVASVIGRYYAMDRDNRWERTEAAFRLFTERTDAETSCGLYDSAASTISASYAQGITDEFIKPSAIRTPQLDRSPTVQANDAVLFFNFRADRMRQLVPAFFKPDVEFPHFHRSLSGVAALASLAEYDANFPLSVLYPPLVVRNHLGQVIADAGLTQLRAAETEKYAHVTYFFSGGEETELPGETRLMVPSKRTVPTYDLVPEMSAPELTEKLLEVLRVSPPDFLVVNFANCDMVGHTGVLSAAIQAVETVDACLSRLLDAIAARGGAALVTADHGNSDQMIDYTTGQPHTFHTLHPVPCILVGTNYQHVTLRPGGALCDIAPTVLELLNVAQPAEMTGTSLLEDPMPEQT